MKPSYCLACGAELVSLDTTCPACHKPVLATVLQFAHNTLPESTMSRQAVYALEESNRLIEQSCACLPVPEFAQVMRQLGESCFFRANEVEEQLYRASFTPEPDQSSPESPEILP